MQAPVTAGLSPVPVVLEPREAVCRFGLLALSTDLTTEGDARRVLPERGTALHVTRVAFENPTTPENLAQMAPRLEGAAALLTPGEPLAAIYYACTSASVAIGNDAITDAITAARPHVPVVTPTRAALAAFAVLGVRRVALVTPYLVATTQPMVDWFAAHGIDVVAARCLGLADDREMARVSTDTIIAAAIEADCRDAEAVFLSCTGLPALGVIPALEARLGKPVISSNQAALWQMLCIAGLPARSTFGQIFSIHSTQREMA